LEEANEGSGENSDLEEIGDEEIEHEAIEEKVQEADAPAERVAALHKVPDKKIQSSILSYIREK